MSRQVKLSEAMGSTLGGLMRSDVSQLAFDDPSDQVIVPDAALMPLSAKDYIADRVSNQITYYTNKAGELERKARRLRALAIVFGAVGTFLAAVSLQIWVAVTTSLVGIFTTLVESRQLETSVTFYNQAAADLTSIRTWWQALPEPERESQATVDRLVDQAERIMRAEHIGWVQEMQDAMTQFRLEQASDEASAKAPAGNSTPDRTTQPAPDASVQPAAADGAPQSGPVTKPTDTPTPSPYSAVSPTTVPQRPTPIRRRAATASAAPDVTPPRVLDTQAASEDVDSADPSDGRRRGDTVARLNDEV
jgi:hypothetical protein